MGAYDFDNIPPLTEEELKNPYAKFYNVPVTRPRDEVYEAIQPGNEMDPSLAVRFDEIEKLFTPGALPCKNGYCLLEDGTGYSAINTLMPDVTPELEQWWNGWYSVDDVHYKVWMPGLHVSHKPPVLEDLGWGMVNVHFLQPLPVSMLMDKDPKELDPNFMACYASAGKNNLVADPSDETYSIICNCVRRLGEGMEIETLAWSGVTVKDGRLVRMIPEGEKADIERVRLFATHNAYEFHRKSVLLPQLYEFSKTLK